MTSETLDKLIVATIVILIAVALFSALAQPLAELLNHAATVTK